MLKELEWDTSELRRKKNRLALMYNPSHNLMDTETEKYILPNSETRTRKATHLNIEYLELAWMFLSFFFPRSIWEWNYLRSEIANSGSLQSFKIKLANYFK